MAILRFGSESLEVLLPHSAVLGRSRGAVVHLDDARVSGQHAAVAWNGLEWTLRDLGSRNGTFLNGRRLESGAREPVRVGDRLYLATPGCCATLVEDAPPAMQAMRTDTGVVLRSDDDVLDLSGATLYGHGPSYLLERDGERMQVVDGQRVRVQNVEWELSLPTRGAPAFTVSDLGSLHLEQVLLRFFVSADEENVEIGVVGPEGERRLPARAFGYLLLLLARARLRDRTAGIVSQEEGWMYADELATALQTDSSRLNVDIFRARRHFERARLLNSAALVERRACTRQVRLGSAKIEIHTASVPSGR